MDGGVPMITAAFEQAVALHSRGELISATAAYHEALQLHPDNVAAHINLGAISFTQRDYESAVTHAEAALRLDSRSSAAHSNLGAALSALERHAEAGTQHATAVELDPQSASALSNMADWLNTVGRHEDALEKLQAALNLRPDYPQALCNQGNAYWALDQLSAAASAFRAAVLHKPDLWVARKNLGMILLQMGCFAEGWAEYDWRFLAIGLRLRPLTTPVWNGGAIAGELLICCEQGLGDQIMYASMAGDLVAKGLRVVWEIEPRLVALFQRSFPDIRVLPRAEPAAPHTEAGPDVVAQFPSGSLGRLLRNDESLFPIMPYLKADPSRVAEMAQRLNLAPGEKLVGISWRSDNGRIGALKSCDFADVAAHLFPSVDASVRYVSLQYGADDSGLALPGLDVTNDLDGLAALITLCDAVVTVSNTTAHMTGALGVPVWVLTGAGRGKLWAWGCTDVTPWYPSARVIRRGHRAGGNEPWSSVLNKVACQLNEFFEGGLNGGQ